MTKADAFSQAIEKLKSDERYIRADYMSDMSNWCMVHATKYLPRKRQDGMMYIPSTAMASDFEIPRTTVHTTLNHVVTAHGYGSWDDMPIVVLASYNDVVAQNGNPAEVAGTDTYWSVNPDTGLMLPESAYIVQPDDNGPLFQIGEHGATYKRDNYTEEEVAQIESMLDPYDREEYMKYKSGEIEQWDIEHEFYGDKRIKQMYDSAKDKQAFLRGLFEETRFGILSKYLRDAVVRMSMDKVGFQYVDTISDSSNTSTLIANVANEHNIPSNPSNKGHSNSLYANIEQKWGGMMRITQGSSFSDVPGLFKTTDVNQVYDIIVKDGLDDPFVLAVVSNIIDNKPIDFVKMYQDAFTTDVELRIEYEQISLKYDSEELNRYATGYYSNLDKDSTDRWIKEYHSRIDRHNAYINDMSAKKTMNAYDKNLGETIHRHCMRLSSEYNAWRNELSAQPGFDKLVQQLRTLIMQGHIHSGGIEHE